MAGFTKYAKIANGMFTILTLRHYVMTMKVAFTTATFLALVSNKFQPFKPCNGISALFRVSSPDMLRLGYRYFVGDSHLRCPIFEVGISLFGPLDEIPLALNGRHGYQFHAVQSPRLSRVCVLCEVGVQNVLPNAFPGT
jgi:hypothetical protein